MVLAYAAGVPDAERPSSPWSLRVILIVVFVVLAWFLFGSGFSRVLRAVIALVGYVVVGFIAYHFGKFVGRHHDEK